jgi:hypothetical protein
MYNTERTSISSSLSQGQSIIIRECWQMQIPLTNEEWYVFEVRTHRWSLYQLHSRSQNQIPTSHFFLKGGYWGLNSGLHACYVGTVQLEPCLQSPISHSCLHYWSITQDDSDYMSGSKDVLSDLIQVHWQKYIQSDTSIHREDSKECSFFSRENCWKKRGLCIIPTKFGASFTVPFLNQVIVLHDCPFSLDLGLQSLPLPTLLPVFSVAREIPFHW